MGLNGLLEKLRAADDDKGVHIAFKTDGEYIIAMTPKTAMMLCGAIDVVTNGTEGASETLRKGMTGFLRAFGCALSKTVNRYECTCFPEEVPEAVPAEEPQAEEKAEGTE